VKRALLFLALTAVVFGDGGAVVLRRESGPFLITAFVSPGAPRAGIVDLSVMVQYRDSLAPVLDAEVSLTFDEAPPILLTHDLAQNKLLYAAPVQLDRAGRWRLDVTVRRGPAGVSVSGEIDVAPALGAIAYWRFLVLPPVAMAVFGMNQLLKSRRLRSGRRAR
jgi:hypothetical protein